MSAPSVTHLLRTTTAAAEKLATRIDSELSFARSLLELDPREVRSPRSPRSPRGLRQAITAAEALTAQVFASADLSRLQAGVADIERLLAPAASLAKQYTIYCVGHAHIDMNWMWGWPETVAVCNDTFTTVLKLMEEFPTFTFSQSQASVYAIMQEYNPALLQQIKKRITEGRWEVTASHWVEGDRNMVSGESLARHLLYTRRYLQQLLGLAPEDISIDWSPDTFGHPASVPMYLRQGAVKYVYLHRPGNLGDKCPGAFWWQSADGARVLVRNDMAQGYNGQITPAVTRPLLAFNKETGLKFVMLVYGVGDHGGGPTRRDLARAIEMDAWPVFPHVKFARAGDFYQRLEAEGAKLPTLSCELNTELTGCYTTQALIKRSNRIAEHRLLDAETACALVSAATGRAYPARELETAWRDTLFGHFHDILPGSNVHDSRTWIHGLFQKTIATTNMAETLALRELAARVNTSSPHAVLVPAAESPLAVTGAGSGWGSDRLPSQADQSGGGDRPLLLFNPTAWERHEVVEAMLWSTVRPASISEEMKQCPISIRLADGQLIPAQKLGHGVYWGHAFTRIAFPVTVPPMGYAIYTAVEKPADAAPDLARQITPPYHYTYVMPDRRPEGLINDHLRLRIDPLTGGIAELTDLKTERVIVSGSMLEYVLEKAHSMSAWVIDNTVLRETPQVVSIERKCEGPYCAKLEVRLRLRGSELTLTYELRAGDPRLHLHLHVLWMERGSKDIGVPSLILSLPTPLEGAVGRYEIPFTEIQRDQNDGHELPALNYAAVVGTLARKKAGLLLLNDCKHGHALDGAALRLTLIRSSYDPDPLPDVAQHEIHLALLPFEGEFSPADAIRLGKDFNRPLRVIPTSVHEGRLPPAASALTVKGDAVLLSLKRAEASEDLVALLTNPSPRPALATLTWNEPLLGHFVSAQQVDLMERPLPISSARLSGNRATLRIPAHGIASLLLRRPRAGEAGKAEKERR